MVVTETCIPSSQEKGVDSMDGAFDTMPKSMFITMIFIGGEWALVDLQVPFGQLTGDS